MFSYYWTSKIFLIHFFFETFFWYIVLISKAIKDAKQWQETQTPIIVMARQLDDQQPPLPTMITIHTDAAWSENSLFAGFEIIIFDATGGIVERKRSGRFCGLSPCWEVSNNSSYPTRWPWNDIQLLWNQTLMI